MSYEKECYSSRLRNPLILRGHSGFYRKSVTAGVTALVIASDALHQNLNGRPFVGAAFSLCPLDAPGCRGQEILRLLSETIPGRSGGPDLAGRRCQRMLS